ncbi:MAG: hypothetical protein U0168_19100 [Nannocystaceae bacterium]
MDETPLLPSAKRAAPSDEGGPGTAGRGWLRRRATLRPDLRAAIALEEAGELLEAARVFEYAGEHGQAALLRLECARTLRDRGERIDVLREGCARNPAGTPEARLLHLALAEALLAEVELESDPATARAHPLAAARALDDADEGARAGEIYEELGLLVRAAAATSAAARSPGSSWCSPCSSTSNSATPRPGRSSRSSTPRSRAPP